MAHQHGDVTKAALLLSLGLCACSSDDVTPGPSPAESTAPCADEAVKGSPFAVRCGQLVDSEGRVAFLRGVNARVEGLFDVSFDDGRTALEEIPAFDASDAEAMREFGFDALRLPLNWSAIEPTESGGFDSAYLDRAASVVGLAEAAGLSVLLDFHQDAYSKEIGEDGAPLWAIEPPPSMLLEGPLTDLEQRRLSSQVLAAFDTFFGDSADGERLRQRFVAMAQHVATRFADHPAVLGIEIFNEPQADDAGIARLNALAYPAIRGAAPDKLYVFEPPTVRNFTDTATLADAPLGPMSAYAPHIYTIAFRGSDAQRQSMTKETLRPSNENAVEEAKSWAAPLMITEWGYGPAAIKASEYLTWQSELQEELFASAFFWVWKESSQGSWGCFDYDASSAVFSERAAVKRALARVRLRRLAGWPESVHFDRASGLFEVSFRADPTINAPHLIAVAPALGPASDVRCDGAALSPLELEHGDLQVECGQGTSSSHQLTIQVQPAP